jgi:hypothetical protein
MVHISSWFMPMMLIYWKEVYNIQENANALLVASKEIKAEIMLILLSTWSCLEIRLQDSVTIPKLNIVPLKG